MTLLSWLTFPLGSVTVTLTVLFFFIYFQLLILLFVLQRLSLLWNSDQVVALVSTDFPAKSKTKDFSVADWERLHGHLRVVPWEDIFKIGASVLLVNFVNRFRLELMYISLVVSIRSSLTHLHGFQLLLLLS